jgi:hypothetical protein
MLKFIVGLLIGYIFAAICQVTQESEAVKQGIMKIYGKYYRITPME